MDTFLTNFLYVAEKNIYLFGFFISVWLLIFLTSALLFYVGRDRQAALCFCALLAFLVLFANGYDFYIHATRAAQFVESFNGLRYDTFIEVEGVYLPIYYYYSPAYYIFAALPISIGVPPEMVVRLLALASFCLMLWSMLALANRALSSGGSSEDHRRAVTLITLIFVSANYVIQNFLTRSAGPETMAYAAIPLAILLILERRILAASCLIALQISLHPVIGPQIIVATFLLSVLLEWPQMLRPWHYFVVLVAALSLSAPFWLIPWLERDAIQGVAALPVRFSETFLSPLTLLDAILKILDQFYYYCQLFFF